MQKPLQDFAWFFSEVYRSSMMFTKIIYISCTTIGYILQKNDKEERKMKRVMLMQIVILIALVTPALSLVGTVNALHNPSVTVDPEFFNGVYPENKTFTVCNNGTGITGPVGIITKVLVVFPRIDPDDVDFEPINFSVKVVLPAPRVVEWSSTYEVLLRQVTFEPIDPSNHGIQPNETFNFTITFRKGPTHQREYVWVVSTTDDVRDAHTMYRSQYIDRTLPNVTITFPANNTDVDGFITVNATADPPTIKDFTWVNVTAYDNISDIKSLELKLDNGAWFPLTSNYTTTGDDTTGHNPYYHFYYQWWSPTTQPSQHTVQARATDNALNNATASSTFRYRLLIDRITVGPTTTEGALGIVYGSIYKTVGTNYTISWTGMLSGSVTVDVYLRSYTSYNATHGTYWVKVGVATGSNLTFTFPTAPKGRYIVRASSSLNYIVKIVDVVEGLVVEPDQIIGPATINSTATGLAAYASSNTIALLCNDTDSLVGINWQTVNMWYTNGNGTLATTIALRTNHFVNTGFVMPTMQPGAYRIAVGATGDYWNASMPGWQSNTYSEAPNPDARQYPVHITVADTLPAIQQAANTAATKADAAKTAAESALSAANNATSAANTAASNTADAKKAAEDAGGKVDGLTMPLYAAVILSLIAAIAAAACAIGVYRKIA